MKFCAIYGERCSGTIYLENLIRSNFDVKTSSLSYHKHFFGFNQEKEEKSEDTLFICIVRNIVDWINSFYREKHCLPPHIRHNTELNEKQKLDAFLNKEIYSIWDLKRSGKVPKQQKRKNG